LLIQQSVILFRTHGNYPRNQLLQFQHRIIITIKTKENLDNSVLGLLHRVVVGDIANISEALSASIFRVEVCRLVHPEDGGSMYLRNVGNIAYNHTV
jgi:hypothetical protein